MERLTNETLKNAIDSYEATIEILSTDEDFEDITVLDRVTIDFLKELLQYRTLEEQGLLLKLPCKVGDVVYVIAPNYNKCLDMYQCEDYDSEQYLVTWCKAHCPNGYKGIGVVEAEVCRIHIWEDTIWIVTDVERKKLDEIGKTVFLTKEEAEAKLKEMEGK